VRSHGSAFAGALVIEVIRVRVSFDLRHELGLDGLFEVLRLGTTFVVDSPASNDDSCSRGKRIAD
jgi:hypothetical protein